jgi:uncharacterized protein
MPSASDFEPVTVIISRRIKPERESDYEIWLQGITQEAHTFPGYLGANVIKPSNKTQPEFVTIFRFDSYENLQRWENSSVRQRWLKLADDMAESDMKIEHSPGLEFWFTPANLPAALTPPRYKMVILLTGVIFGLSISVSPVLVYFLRGLPPHLRQLIIISIQSSLMTYFIMPFLTKWLKKWLFSSSIK